MASAPKVQVEGRNKHRVTCRMSEGASRRGSVLKGPDRLRR